MYVKDTFPRECLFPVEHVFPIMLVAFDSAAREIGREWTLTSNTDEDPKRSVNSWHRYGLAIDGALRGPYSETMHERWRDEIKARLGYLFDVTFHHRHVHAEFDPKGKRG